MLSGQEADLQAPVVMVVGGVWISLVLSEKQLSEDELKKISWLCELEEEKPNIRFSKPLTIQAEGDLWILSNKI